MNQTIERRWKRLGLAAMQAALFSSFCAAGGFSSLAFTLSRAARQAEIRRVAVLPFTPCADGGAAEGRRIAENLITRLVQQGKVQVVARSMLAGIRAEDRLDMSGQVDLATVGRMGRLAAADALVTGDFERAGNREIVNARLIKIQTGVILAAVSKRVRTERPASGGLFSDLFGGAGNNDDNDREIRVSQPSFFVPVPRISDAPMPEMADAGGGQASASCSDAAGRIDSLETRILDLKARYWAIRLRDGVSFSSLKFNPGSEISDPALKREFYSRMQYWYSQGRIPALAPDEVRRLLAIDGRAFSLYRECGV